MINEPHPLNRDYNGDPNMKALKRRGFITHGSTLVSFGWVNLRLRASHPLQGEATEVREDAVGV